METFLGLDFGTQGVKGIIISREGETLASSRKDYGFCTNSNGYIEQDPYDWVAAATEAISEMKKQNKDSFGNISAVGIAGQMHGIIPISENKTPLCNCLLWCDTRNTSEINAFQKKLDEDTIRNLRNPFVSAYSAGKILWIKENEPDIWNKTRHFVFCKDFIRLLMTGDVATDHSDASGSLLYDFQQGNWSSKACKALGISKTLLPRIFSSYEVAGTIIEEGAQLFGLKKGIPVVVGAGDLAASLLGSNIEMENELLINLGTAGQVLSLTHAADFTNQGGYLFRFLDKRTDMTLFSIPSAAYCVRWFIENICPIILKDAEEINVSPFVLMHQYAEKSSIGSRKLIFAPYLSGSGSPYLDDGVRAAWIGLDSSHTYIDLCRSILEGVAFGIKDCIESAGGVTKFNRIYFTGGGAKSQLWREIIANVCNYPLSCSNETEAASYGAARLAARGYGINIKNCADSYEKELPKSKDSRLYENFYLKYRKIYPAISNIMD